MAFTIGELSFISGLPINLPIERGLDSGPEVTTVKGLPGELDARMAAGELDAGPVSSLEYVRHHERYMLVPDLSISSWGRFASAVLFSKGSFGRLTGKTVALPRGGATSNVLTQWFLHQSFGSDATFVEAEGPIEELLATYDAALVIGDQALIETRKAHDYLTFDLGEGWWQLMKTPMVQTVWVVQRRLSEAEQLDLIGMFNKAKALGKEEHAEVVSVASERLGIPASELEAYYGLLNYDLSSVHQQSLTLFSDYLLSHQQEASKA